MNLPVSYIAVWKVNFLNNKKLSLAIFKTEQKKAVTVFGKMIHYQKQSKSIKYNKNIAQERKTNSIYWCVIDSKKG